MKAVKIKQHPHHHPETYQFPIDTQVVGSEPIKGPIFESWLEGDTGGLWKQDDRKSNISMKVKLPAT